MLYQLSYRGMLSRGGGRITSWGRLAKREFALRRNFVISSEGRRVALAVAPLVALWTTRPGAMRSGRGLVAEWLRRGLQILAPRFDSGRGLQIVLSRRVATDGAVAGAFEGPGHV